MSYKLPKLLYSYDSLEPYIDKETMEIHHTRHHQTYIDNVNRILANTCYLTYSASELIKNLQTIDIEEKESLKNNLGGHINHSLFWLNLKLGTKLNGNLKLAIKKQFSSFENFVSLFEEAALKHFGSGWIWLINSLGKLKIVTTINQNNPLMGEKINGFFGNPIICLDIWEHAYYLKYKNRRIEYIKSYWNIVNWEEAERRFLLKNI
ncbi:Fe-Mn family superoxide dismutase [Buchnera aphidicola]|uniref:Fe-Mn family superoxide dismutase n=1 Tax=Buchnera aphidicola TaxID=9 RepID=UPI0034639B47